MGNVDNWFSLLFFLGHFAFQQQCLIAHNELRKEHGCPALKWSADLAEHAQAWADKLAERGRSLYAEIPGKIF